MMRSIMVVPSVLVLSALAARLLHLGLEEEGAVDDDGLPGFQAGEDLHFTAQVAPATDGPHLERPLPRRDEHAPFVVESLERSRRDREDGGPGIPDGEPYAGGHPWPQHTRRVRQLDADRDRAGADFHLAADGEDTA